MGRKYQLYLKYDSLLITKGRDFVNVYILNYSCVFHSRCPDLSRFHISLFCVVISLGGLLWTTDLAPSIKELIFHLLAELLRKIHHLEQQKCPSGLSSSIALLLNPCLAVLMALQTEVRKLYDQETQGWTTGGVGAGGASAGSIALALGAEQSRFSTYFHALMEVCLAVAEVTLPLNVGPSSVGALSSTSAPNLSDSSSSSSSSPGQTPQSPSLLSKRKKVKMKRERAAAVAAVVSGKRGSGGAQLSESDSALLSMAGGKPEDILWFHRCLTLLMILRHLANKDPQGLSVTCDAVTDACQALVGPTAHSRLLVLSGIPAHLEEAVVRNAIRRACNAHGGLFKDEIFIPLQEDNPKKTKTGSGVCSTQDGKAGPEPEHPFLNNEGPESPDSSSSVTPALSVSTSASTSQTSICSSSQGVPCTASELFVDQELLALRSFNPNMAPVVSGPADCFKPGEPGCLPV